MLKKLISLLVLSLCIFCIYSTVSAVCCSPVGFGLGCGTCMDGKDKCGCCGAGTGYLAGCNIFCCNCDGGCRHGGPEGCRKHCDAIESICEQGCAGTGGGPRCYEACEKDKERCYDDCRHAPDSCDKKFELWKEKLPPWMD